MRRFARRWFLLLLVFSLACIFTCSWVPLKSDFLNKTQDPFGRQLVALTVTREGCANSTFLPIQGYCVWGCASKVWKLRCVLTGLREIQRQSLATHVLVVDDDVAFADWTPRKIFEIFDSFRLPLVVSVERTLWNGPFGGKMNYDFGENLYVNSGAYMGELEALVSALEEIRRAQVDFSTGRLPLGQPTSFSLKLYHKKEKSNEQTMLNLYVNQRFNQTVGLDAGRLLFFSLGDVVAHRCESIDETMKFVPPIAHWDETWCGGWYQRRNTSSDKVTRWPTRRDPQRLWCNLSAGSSSCGEEFGIGPECQAYINGRTHDDYLNDVRHPLLLHASAGFYEGDVKNRRSMWKARCPDSKEYSDLGHLLVLENTHILEGFDVPLTSWDILPSSTTSPTSSKYPR